MEFKELISLGGFVIAIGGIFWNFAASRQKDKDIQDHLDVKIDRHIADNEKMYSTVLSQLNRLWEYKDTHDKEAAQMRLDLQKQIGKVEAGLSIHDGQYAEILRLIESMSKTVGEKIDKLETKFEKYVKN